MTCPRCWASSAGPCDTAGSSRRRAAFSNPYYYSDPTHQTPFGLYTFSYFAEDHLLRRQVPSYARRPEFAVRSLTLGFKSPRPFYGRFAVKRALQILINLNHWTKELYEENLCYLMPCYELHVRLERLGTQASV